MPQKMENISVRPINASQTHALRRAILRPGRALADSIYPRDDAAETLHLGAWCADKIVGIASIYPEEWSLQPNSKAWRLRGMAVDPNFQRRGIGASLVQSCISHVREQGGEVLWCNARKIASDFYRELGFRSVGEEFEIEAIGPHFVMHHNLSLNP